MASDFLIGHNLHIVIPGDFMSIELLRFEQWVFENEVVIRLSSFLTIFALMAVWEMLSPRRALSVSKSIRWLNNVALVVLNSIVLRLLFPAAAVGLAAFVSESQWGILNYYQVPHWPAILISVVVMDFFIYLQHIMVHAIPVLWRLHRVHHADLDFDVSTGLRFHPLEIILSMLIKFAIILVLGPPVLAVVIFEVILNGMAMFNHSNIKLPLGFERILRWVLVTPDMHRVHHSIDDEETNSNFGFNLSLWDRIFGTYCQQPEAGHEGMTIGIRDFRGIGQVGWLWGILLMPFRGKITGYTINKRRWLKKSN